MRSFPFFLIENRDAFLFLQYFLMTYLNLSDVILKTDLMKAFKYIFFLAVISILFACSKDDSNDQQQDLQQFVSAICPEISGARAVYWDGAHNLATPLAQIPTLANPGQQFIHPQYPALGFTMPQGYFAQEITDSQTGAIGVNVFRNDNNVIWRYLPSASFQGQIPINDIVAFEVNQLKSFYEITTTEVKICEEQATSFEFGFETNYASRLLVVGNITAQLIIQTHYMQDLNSTFVSITLASGPSAEFGTLIMDTFLPIHWQLMVISDDVRDSDLDGTPDNQDAAPFNPNIQ
jgi:hypothetical protein